MAILNKKSKESLKANLELEPEIQRLDKAMRPEAGQEVLSTPEKESALPDIETVQEEIESKAPAATGVSKQSSVASPKKSERLQRIEQLLEEDLGETFSTMDDQHRQMFKRSGEDTAKQIEGLLAHAKVKVQKIFELIKIWLTMIPGVNKWFVVQESKIKTDKLIHLEKKP